jgi:hypothetical protein
MAENKGASKARDAGQSEAQQSYDEAAKRGYFGRVPTQPPNSAFSMESGPDSPSPLEQHIALHDAKGDEMRASTAEGAK